MSRLVGAGSEEGSRVGMTRRGSGGQLMAATTNTKTTITKPRISPQTRTKSGSFLFTGWGSCCTNVVSERYAQMTSKRKPSTRNKGSEEPTSPQPKRKRGPPRKTGQNRRHAPQRRSLPSLAFPPTNSPGPSSRIQEAWHYCYISPFHRQ